MIRYKDKEFKTFQEAIEVGLDEGSMGQFEVKLYWDDGIPDEDTILLSSHQVYYDLGELLQELYETFPEQYKEIIKTDEV